MANTGKTKYVNPDASRNDFQQKIMIGYQENEICPFCKEHFLPNHSEEILWTKEYWLVTKNTWPYAHTKHHFLLILNRHADDISQLSSQEWEELRQHCVTLQKQFSIHGGALVMRFGDITKNTSSVAHLHAHLIESDNCNADHKPVRVKIG